MIVLKIFTTIALAIFGLMSVCVVTSNQNKANIRLLSLVIAMSQALAIVFMWQ